VTTPVKRKRGEGQWKLGYREPLNPNERTKKDDDGLNVRARIENVYAKRGFDSIDPADLRGRMRWWGLYTQRKPGIDGGRTAVLEPEELDDRYFMLRVRIDGGALTTSQLRTLGEISQTHARDTADITDRQNIQYHWIDIVDMPAIWQRLEAEDMRTTEACGDTPRVILGSPVAGIAADDEIDPQPAIDTILERWIGNPEFSNLPRKFKTAISWQQDVAHEVNDVSFVGVVHPEHGPGFDVWVGGGLSTNPKIAQRLGAWIPLDEIPDVWCGIVSIFRDYGYRRLRHRARIKFLVADWGPAEFRRVLEEEYLGRALHDGPAPAIPAVPIDHIGVHKQRDGRNYVGVAPASGRVSGTTLIALADAAERAGCWTCPTRRSTSSPASSPTSGCRPSPRRGGAPPWRARASSSASSRSSRRRNARSGSSTTWRSASPTSTRAPRSPSTSTAAPTPAPAPRSPTSGSRA
jgi:sulfite reductase (ferredoxin)